MPIALIKKAHTRLLDVKRLNKHEVRVCVIVAPDFQDFVSRTFIRIEAEKRQNAQSKGKQTVCVKTQGWHDA